MDGDGCRSGSPAACGAWRSSPWFMLAVLTTVNAVNWADRQVVPILFPAIQADLGLSDTELGIIGGIAFSLVYALAALVFGRAADHRIRRNLIAGGLVLWSLATAASGLAGSFGSLFAARFLTGIGEASLYPCALSWIAERFPSSQRGRAVGIFGAAVAVGSGLGISLGGYLSEVVGWRNVFLLYGGGGLALLPVLVMLPEAPRVHSDDADIPAARIIVGLLADKRLVVMWMSGMVMIAAGIGYNAWIPTYFVRVRSFGIADAGYLFGAASLLGGVVGSLVGGAMADRRRRVRKAGELDVSAVAALVSVPVVLLTLGATYPPLFVAGGLLGPVAIFAFFPSLQTMVIELVPPRRLGLAYAVNILFLGGIGSAAGPFIVGYASDVTGSLHAAMQLPLGMMMVASVLAVYTGRLVRATSPAED